MCLYMCIYALCGLNPPVFSSLDSVQRPALREMEEKQVCRTSAAHPHIHQFGFHSTIFLCF